VLKKWRIFERDDFTGVAEQQRDELAKLVEELEDACEKFEIAKQRRLERIAKVAEKRAAKNLLVTSSAS
jgi:acyl-[acyl-carrier-protein] desaturase